MGGQIVQYKRGTQRTIANPVSMSMPMLLVLASTTTTTIMLVTNGCASSKRVLKVRGSNNGHVCRKCWLVAAFSCRGSGDDVPTCCLGHTISRLNLDRPLILASSSQKAGQCYSCCWRWLQFVWTAAIGVVLL